MPLIPVFWRISELKANLNLQSRFCLKKPSWVWWHAPLIPEFGRQKAGWISELEATSQCYIVRSCLKVPALDPLTPPPLLSSLFLSQHTGLEENYIIQDYLLFLYKYYFSQNFLCLTWLPVLHVRSRTLYTPNKRFYKVKKLCLVKHLLNVHSFT